MGVAIPYVDAVIQLHGGPPCHFRSHSVCRDVMVKGLTVFGENLFLI